ncbi:MAG: biotin--[acetyl-CoA-carboxylase] ligase [Bacteroidales bacterium]|nr:biotin--[acetyl-CoA-carboxylase] ligase [Bacteroidales bacterium]
MPSIFKEEHIFHFDSLTSTNDYAVSMLDSSKEDAFVIVTGEQTKGKGQSGNVWLSEKGKNLILSLVLKPDFLKIEDQFQLNKITSLAVRDFCMEQTQNMCQVYIKWPNDIYLNNKKTAGILIENFIVGSEYKHAVIGIGININQVKFPPEIPNATSIANETAAYINLETALTNFINHFEKWLKLLKNNETEEIHKEYLKSLYQLGTLANYSFKNTMIKAQITGVDNFGRLALCKDNGELIFCNMKEIKFM